MSAQGPPVRSRQKMPLSTRRSSTRGTPRGFFGNSGWITDPSKFVRLKRAIGASWLGGLIRTSPIRESRLWVHDLVCLLALLLACPSGAAAQTNRADQAAGVYYPE